jgi:broad specificity phosphatase PhoE
MQPAQLRVLFVRHGQRNNFARVPNNAQIPLTELGHRQARIAGDCLAAALGESRGSSRCSDDTGGGATLNSIVVYSSPFLRCLQTSEGIAAALQCSYTPHALLCELIDDHDFDASPLAPHLPHLQSPTLAHAPTESFATAFPRAVVAADCCSVERLPVWPESRGAFEARLGALLLELASRHSANAPQTAATSAAAVDCVGGGASTTDAALASSSSSSVAPTTVVCVCHGMFMEQLLASCFFDVDYGRDPYVGNTCIADILFSAPPAAIQQASLSSPSCSVTASDFEEHLPLRQYLRQGPLGIGHAHLTGDNVSF